jgi:UPF0755 protein
VTRTGAPKKPKPKRRGGGPPRRAGRQKTKRGRSSIGWAIAAALLLPLAALYGCAKLHGPGDGRPVAFRVDPGTDTAAALAQHGLVRSPFLFRWYARLLRPTASFIPGVHLVDDRLSSSEIVDRLARSRWRGKVKITLVEGFHQTQVQGRLERSGVAAKESLALDADLRRELGITGTTLEGYWAPATWDLYVDADPKELMRLMVRSTRKRLERVAARHPGALDALRQTRGWREHEILTLASIIEKETAHADERPIVASVYLNRLDDPSFVPRGRLQADPTAVYPCQVTTEGARPASCADFDRGGKVTPRMLRDATNPYNTYLRAGLPPGPICSPSETSIEAVLAPAQSDYLFFVASGNGRHTFSRTFGEHNQAIRREH